MEAENQRPVTPINKERLITCPGAPKKKDRNWADLLEDDFLEIELTQHVDNAAKQTFTHGDRGDLTSAGHFHALLH